MPDFKQITSKGDIKIKKDEKLQQDPVANVVDTSQEIEKIINTIHAEYEKSNTNRSVWQLNQAKWYRQRYGVRPKATFPWKNSSNLHMPLIDKTIRKMKPEYVSSVWNSNPICTLTPEDSNFLQIADEASYSLDYVARAKMNIYPTLVRLADIILQKGFAIVKTVYEKRYEPKTVIFVKSEAKKTLLKTLINKEDADIFENVEKMDKLINILVNTYGFEMDDESDSAKVNSIVKEIYGGADEVEFTVDVLVYDAPKAIPLDPECVYVASDTITEFDLEAANLIIHRYKVSVQDCIYNVSIGKWDEDAVIETLRKKGIDNYEDLKLKSLESDNSGDVNKNATEVYKNKREGQGQGMSDDCIDVHECCLWYDSDGDGKDERHILEYACDYQLKPLRFIRYPYTMAMWPYAKIPFELTDGAHYSPRGIAEILNPIAVALNEQHNMKLNRQFLGNTPYMFYNTELINKFEFQNIAPGKPVGVSGDPNQAILWSQAPSNDATFMNEETILKNWAEDMSASTDQSSINQSKTAMEARLIATNRVGARQMDIDIWNMGLREVFKRIMALWLQYGAKSQYVPTDRSGQLRQIMVQSFNKNWKFNVNGKIGTADPVLNAQKAMQNLQQFKGDPHVEQEELYYQFFYQDNYLTAKRLLKDPQKFAQEQAAQAQMMKAQADDAYRKQLTLEMIKKTQNLDINQIEAEAQDLMTPDPTPEQIAQAQAQGQPQSNATQQITRGQPGQV